MWSDLNSRIASGVVLALVGAALLLSGGIILRLGMSALMGGMLWELTRLTAMRDSRPLNASHALLTAVMGGLALFVMLGVQGYGVLVLTFVPVAFTYGRADPRDRGAHALFMMVILLAGYGLVTIREFAGLGTLLWIMATVILSDVLGYFAGRHFGGPKFWPAISPKKTWSGTVAGWLGAFVLAVVLLMAGQAGWSILLLGPLVAVAGQMGDIAESWLKRRVGVKDSSNLIPGHGGLMDRFDAMTGSLLLALVLLVIGILPVIGG